MTALSHRQLQTVAGATGSVNIWHGSIRSGKTVASLLRWLLYLSHAPGGEMVIVGRTRDSAWRNVIAPLQDPAVTGSVAKEIVGNYGAPTATMLGRRVHILGASDSKAELVIRGLTVAGAYVDEITALPEQFFTQLLGRMSVRGAKLFGTTNPDSPAHWLKAKFLDRADELPDWRVAQLTMADNPGLTPEYVAAKSREFTGLWHRRFIKGEWVAAEGAVYSMWDPARHVIPDADVPPLARLLCVGVDYGTTNSSAAILIGLTSEPSPRLIAASEWRYNPSTQHRLTDAQLSERYRAWQAELPRPPEWVAVDPAAASFKAQLYHDGLPSMVDADNAVVYGIRTVASLLSTGQLLISSACPELIKEIPGYSWDDKATLQGEDRPVKVADHSLDALRYAVTTSEPLWRNALRRATESG